MLNLTKKSKVIAGVTLAVLATTGTAFAYWTTTGGGTGSGTTGTSTAVTVTQTSTVSALSPGSSAQPLDFTITNPSSTNQSIASVVISISSVTGPNISLANPCAAADYTVVQPTATYGDLTPGDHTYAPSGATLAMKNTSANQDGCKGATVNLAYAAS